MKFLRKILSEDEIFFYVKMKCLVARGSMVNGCWLVQETEHSGMTASTVDRKRRIASIFQHYYPEGGWGLVLLLSVVLVQEMSTNLREFFTVPG